MTEDSSAAQSEVNPKEEATKEKAKLTFGRYEGYWEDARDTCTYEAVIDEANFTITKTESDATLGGGQRMYFDGFIEWRITRIENHAMMRKSLVGAQGIEKVRGYYESLSNLFKCVGYRVFEGKSGMLGIAAYRSIFFGPKVPLMTYSWSESWSDSTMEVKRVASKRELYQLISDKFDEKNIVNIITQLLHFIDISEMIESKEGEWYFSKILKGVNDDKINEMCLDIPYYSR